MRFLVVGNGKMGEIFQRLYPQEISLSSSDPKELLHHPHDFDAVVDFSHPDLLDVSIRLAVENKVPLLIGTTGLSQIQKAKIREISDMIPVCVDANYSPGILRLKRCFSLFEGYDVEIEETHHIHKKDAPSGTALLLKENLEEKGFRNIEILSKRKGEIFGIHEVIFRRGFEKISLVHEAEGRELFTIGAHDALEKLVRKKKGCYDYEKLASEQ